MTAYFNRNCFSVALSGLIVLLAAAGLRAQDKQIAYFTNGDPTLAAPVAGAPYSAEGVTTVKMRMYDGTRIDRSVTAKFYRDNAGRVRREQTIVGLEVLDPATDFRSVVHIVDPVAGVMYTLNPGSRTAHRLPIGVLKTDSPAQGGAKRESLGTKDIDGFKATGTRDVVVIPAGQIGNDRPIEISDERWVSTDLKVVLYSKHSDPRSGDIEFRLTKISRQEPAKELFAVPAGFKIMSETGSDPESQGSDPTPR